MLGLFARDVAALCARTAPVLARALAIAAPEIEAQQCRAFTAASRVLLASEAPTVRPVYWPC